MAKKIVDVSSYNGTIKWKKMKEKGVQGAIIKIISRDRKRDSQFNRNYKGCRDNKIPWGVYNYTYAVTVKKVKSDMKLICDILDGLDKTNFKLGVWLDLEDGAQAKLSKDKIAKIINAAQKVVEKRGYPFGVYTGMSYFKEHIDKNKVICKNWWIARYYKGYAKMNISETPDKGYKPAVVSDLFAWQYTSTGIVADNISNGDDGLFDLNMQYRNLKKPSNKPKGYSGIFPALPPRGYYQVGDGYRTLVNYKTQIKRVQKALNWAMGKDIKVDGKYGKATQALEKKLQKKYKLPVNGKFGDKSLAVVKKIKK